MSIKKELKTMRLIPRNAQIEEQFAMMKYASILLLGITLGMIL